jgi:hypothetical protein
MTNVSKPALVLVSLLFLSLIASAQWVERPHTGTSQTYLADRTNMAGMVGMGPQLEVFLVDADKNAVDKRAVVRIDVWGVDLVEPQSNQEPKLTQAYVTYQLDSGEVVRTAAEEHTFENLTPGYHHVYVQLASLDNQPFGARLTLTVHVPK